MRRSAESGSPCEPVEMITTRSSEKSAISRGPTSRPSGISMWPRLRPIPTFLRIERPTSATLRSSAWAASTTCWTRWMFAAELGQPRDVRGRAVDGRLVKLVVAGDQHGAEVGADRHGAGVGDRVGHLHQLQRERPQLEAFAGLDLVQLDVAQLVLVQLGRS